MHNLGQREQRNKNKEVGDAVREIVLFLLVVVLAVWLVKEQR
jgi:hypothetical protein